MGKVKFTTEQIINKLREAEVLQSQGLNISMICKRLEIHEQTYYRWRKEYGGIQNRPSQKVEGFRTRKCTVKENSSRSINR